MGIAEVLSKLNKQKDVPSSGKSSNVSGVAKMRFGLTARISFYERFCAFIEAGIPVFETVESIKRRYEKKRDWKAKMMDEWLDVMRNGTRFSDAIKDWIPVNEYMLISAGERGQGLIQGLKEAIRLSSAAAAIKKSIVVGSTMPAVLFLMLCGMMAGFDLYMAPVFMGLLPVAKWPDNAQLLYTIGHFIVQYSPIIAAIMGGLVFIIATTMGKWTGPTRDIFDKLPPWSLYKNYQASSFLIALASMMKAGVALNDAIKVMGKNASPWMQVHLSQMSASLKVGGGNYGKAMNTGLFDDDTSGDLEDYSRLSSFENAIYIIGERMVTQSIEKTNERMAVAKNIMLFLVAGTVFWIYATSYNLQTIISEQMQNPRSR